MSPDEIRMATLYFGIHSQRIRGVGVTTDVTFMNPVSHDHAGPQRLVGPCLLEETPKCLTAARLAGVRLVSRLRWLSARRSTSR